MTNISRASLMPCMNQTAVLGLSGVLKVADRDHETPQAAGRHCPLGQLFPTRLENKPLGAGQGKRGRFQRFT